jgi:hypothetical protein
MKFFKDAQNNVYAYESDGSQDALIPSGLTPITSQQADALRVPELTDAEWNENVDAQLMAADLKIIRALTEGDTVRIDAHKAAQATLRATRR